MGCRLSAGLVVARKHNGQLRLLLLRVYRNWDFPKGCVEAGEAPLDAALRETREEADLNAFDFPWGTGYRETAPYARGKVARYYLAESRSGDVRLPINPELGRPEHHAFRWATPTEARNLLPVRLQPILDWALQTIQ